MSEIDNGGPEFPFCHEIESDKPGMRAVYVERGMSLRDYFAAKAMQGLASKPGSPDYEYEAMAAYKYADAMIAEREKQK